MALPNLSATSPLGESLQLKNSARVPTVRPPCGCKPFACLRSMHVQRGFVPRLFRAVNRIGPSMVLASAIQKKP